MINQLLLGSIVIVSTVIIQVVLFNVAILYLTRIANWLNNPASFLKTSIVMTAVVLWTLLAITIIAWVWAFLLLQVGALNALEEALYFVTVTLTTLGYGDITLNANWRLLSSMIAVNGLIIFGLNTAFLVQFIQKTRGLHIKDNTRADD
ncbi:MAG: potassium channel family protein [Cellvibrionaceae bacterium]